MSLLWKLVRLYKYAGWVPEEPETPYHSLFEKAFPGSGHPHPERCARWTAGTKESMH